MANSDKRLLEFGRRIKEVRNYMKLTQKEVAEKVGLQQMSVSRMEQGKELSGKKLMKFLDFYSQFISIDCLFADKFDLIGQENIAHLFEKGSVDKILENKLKNSIKKLDEAKKQVQDIIDYIK